MSKEIEEVTEEIIEDSKFADHIGFQDLYVVKGLRGIFITVGQPNKDGLIALREWGKNMIEREVKMVKVQNISNLGRFMFNTLDEKIIQVPVDNSEVEKLEKEINTLFLQAKDSRDKEEFGEYMQKVDAINQEIEELKDSEDFKYEDKKVPVILGIRDVFNNLNDLEQDVESILDYNTIINMGVLENTMQRAVPNYDPEEFKKHHLRDCIKWYNLTKSYLEELEEVSA